MIVYPNAKINLGLNSRKKKSAILLCSARNSTLKFQDSDLLTMRRSQAAELI